MSQAAKRFARMRANPLDDWRIEDIVMVCREYGITCRPPSRGSHYTLSHPRVDLIFTVPAHRTIEPIYIRNLYVMF